MQKKVLGSMLSIVPRDSFRMNLPFYTKLFEHFFEIKDFEGFKKMLEFPNYLIDKDHLIKLVSNGMEANRELGENAVV
jgi:hypothetical protein